MPDDSFYKILQALPEPALKGFIDWAVVDMARQTGHLLILNYNKLNHLSIAAYIEEIQNQFQEQIDLEAVSDGFAIIFAAQLADSRNLPNAIALIDYLLLYIQFCCIADLEEDVGKNIAQEMRKRQQAKLGRIAELYGIE